MSKISLCILFFLLSCLSSKAQVLFTSDCFRGGVVADGYIPWWFGPESDLQLPVPSGASIRKAYLLSNLFVDQNYNGPIPEHTIQLNGVNITLSESQLWGFGYNLDNSNLMSFPLFVDITNFFNNSTTTYTLNPFSNGVIPPYQKPFYSDFYILVFYEDLNLPVTCVDVFLNQQDALPQNEYNISLTNSVDFTNSIGLSINGTSFCDTIIDWSTIIVNGNNIGTIGGTEYNSHTDCAGPFGSFYYQNGTLFGLANDISDSIMYGTDAIADIQPYMNASANVELRCVNPFLPTSNPKAPYSNQFNHFIFTYTSPCDTFTATLTSDTAVCAGDTLQLNATGGGSAGSAPPYEWTPQIGLSCYDCPNPVFSFPHDTVINYSVRIRNNDSCSKVLPLGIWVKPKPHITNLNITKPACGSTNGQIDITGVSGAQPPYQYALNGQTQSTGLFSGVTAGTYPLTITGANGCAFDTVITLNDTLLVNAQFTANPQEGAAPLTVQFANQSANASNYVWLINGETFTTENITYSFQQSGNYNAVLVAYNNTPGCADTFSMDIFVYDDLSVIVPNIFTPNTDGVNDVFGVNVNVGCTVQAFIYNRWGAEMLNITKEISGAGFIELWNGHNHTDGVYFYVIKAKPNFGEEQVLKGNVTLVR